MSKAVEYNATTVQSIVRLFDLVTARPVEGVTIENHPDLVLYYKQDELGGVQVPLIDKAAVDAWEEGGWRGLVDGYYSIDMPDAAWVPTITDRGDPVRGTFVIAHDLVQDYMCIGSYHPLQRVLESVSFSPDGGLYCTAADLYDVFGKANIYKWANMESLPESDPNYETTIQARITKAITYSTSDINDKLRGGPYAIPFTDTNLTASINYACTIKSGVWLYEWRGADDFDYEGGRLTHRYTFMMDRADTMMEQVRRDARRLGLAGNQTIRTRAPGAGVE